MGFTCALDYFSSLAKTDLGNGEKHVPSGHQSSLSCYQAKLRKIDVEITNEGCFQGRNGTLNLLSQLPLCFAYIKVLLGESVPPTATDILFTCNSCDDLPGESYERTYTDETVGFPMHSYARDDPKQYQRMLWQRMQSNMSSLRQFMQSAAFSRH